MAKKLVIVESPTKARTMSRFLGRDYAIEASIGHIRDLPENRLGVDVEKNFEPRYVIPEKKKEVVKRLKEKAREASEIFLATDPDREGEAISWHLVEALNLNNGKPVRRVEFHEITREAIRQAFAHPRSINMRLVDAQQARRILDRLVGYKLSPLLRKKMTKRGLSAGRVQSVAVKLIVDREREIRAFVPEEYWTLEAELKCTSERSRRAKTFRAALVQVAGEKPNLKSESDAQAVLADLEGATYVVADVRKREVQRNPAPPFTTSTLQQEAARKLGFTAKRTMAVAQQLYEGVQLGREGSTGLITYMRTDSTNVAASAQQAALSFIRQRYGEQFAPASPRVFKSKAKGAQEAHEAIRPTDVMREPDAIRQYLTGEQYKLYRLIWQRFVASQMAAAVLDSTSIDVAAGRPAEPNKYLFRATGAVVKFEGFMKVYTEGRDDGDADEHDGKKALPELQPGEALRLVKLHPEQHFTQPPPRYTEASLVKALEEYGIGRPSTYAPTLSTIQDRGYVSRDGKSLVATPLGELVTDLLVQHFKDIVDVGFTAEMEERLDQIANEDVEWVKVLWDFYGPFERTLASAEHQMPEVQVAPEPAGEICDRCGAPMVIKYGRFGKFIACSAYPKCRNSKSFMVKIGTHCPRCRSDLVEKRTKRRRIFYSCSAYPQCDFAVWQRPLPEALQPCPHCRGLLVEAARGQAKCVQCENVIARPEEPITASAS